MAIMLSMLSGKKIFVVSQPGKVIDGICSRLRTKGIGIELCTSGFQAISIIEKKVSREELLYDLLIIFGDSEDMPAREILNLTRLNVDNKKLPIFVMDKASDTDTIIQLRNEGADEYLVDFNDFSKILEKLSKLLS